MESFQNNEHISEWGRYEILIFETWKYRHQGLL